MVTGCGHPEVGRMKMPTLFIGHGSPMNAIEKNAFTDLLATLPTRFEKPKAILVVSAHWETRGGQVLKVLRPETIHDFGGFPKELFAVQYRPPGAPEVADKILQLLQHHGVRASTSWGLDHGAWSILKHMYPQADVPVLQLSLNRDFSLEQHLELAKDLGGLRELGILILGSGNVTHNLRLIDWRPGAPIMGWAQEFDQMIKSALENRDEKVLLAKENGAQWNQAHPSLEHYIPLLYAYGATGPTEKIEFIFESIEMGSLSMRSFLVSA